MHNQVTDTAGYTNSNQFPPPNPPQGFSRVKVSSKADFFKVLKARVEARLRPEERKDVPRHYAKAAFIMSGMLGLYALLFVVQIPWVQFLVCILLGVSHATIGFNVFHESIHGSFSKHQWVNRALAFISCSLIGGGHFFWRHKHNYLHHQFPNIQNLDDDLETRGWLRFSPSQKWLPIYKIQHLYAPLVYCFVTLEWLFAKDFKQYFSGQMNEYQTLPKLKPWDKFEFWLSKLIYFNLFLLIPYFNFPQTHFFVGFVAFHFATGLTLSAIFQLAHVMPDSEYPLPDATGSMQMSWEALQLKTTVNFAPKNRFICWLSGGLNYQIEHHLFPQLPHTCYPRIAPVVEATAREYSLPYHSIPSYFAALKNHFRMLKALGLSKF